MTLTDKQGVKYKAIKGQIKDGDLVFNTVLKKARRAIKSDMFTVVLYNGTKWMNPNVVKVEEEL